MKQNKKISLIVAITLTLIFSFAKATTFLECGSADIKSCTKEVTKGEAIKALASGSKSKFVKVDFVKFDDDKGTLKIDKK